MTQNELLCFLCSSRFLYFSRERGSVLISASCSFSCNSISLTYYSSSFLFVPLGSTLATFHGNKLISETLHTKQMCINIKTLYIEGKYKVLVRERWYTSSCYVIKVRSSLCSVTILFSSHCPRLHHSFVCIVP